MTRAIEHLSVLRVTALLCLCAIAGQSVLVIAGERDLEIARPAAESWISLIDRGAYTESWDRAAEIFQARMDRWRWIESLETNRAPLGEVQSRKFRSAQYVADLPDSPRGE